MPNTNTSQQTVPNSNAASTGKRLTPVDSSRKLARHANSRKHRDARTVEIDVLMSQFGIGSKERDDRLWSLAYPDLHAMAASFLFRYWQVHEWEPGDLIHETYIRLHSGRDASWSGTQHFFRSVFKMMRWVLVDYGRERRAGKRAFRRADIDVDSVVQTDRLSSYTYTLLNQALNRLRSHDVLQYKILRLRLVNGLTWKAIGIALGTCPTAAKGEAKRGLKTLRFGPSDFRHDKPGAVGSWPYGEA